MPTCYDCMYMDRRDCQSGFLVDRYYCSEMKRYISRNTTACGRFVQRTDSGCYLTSACTEYKGLPDDCYELTTLRAFRDEYVLRLEGGKKLVDKYYATAPAIVEKINASEKKDEILTKTYDYILKCVKLIKEENNEAALELYKDMVEKFSLKFL